MFHILIACKLTVVVQLVACVGAIATAVFYLRAHTHCYSLNAFWRFLYHVLDVFRSFDLPALDVCCWRCALA